MTAAHTLLLMFLLMGAAAAWRDHRNRKKNQP
jgi:hypothetical protein